MIFPALMLGPIVEALSLMTAASSAPSIAVVVLTVVFGLVYPARDHGFAQSPSRTRRTAA